MINKKAADRDLENPHQPYLYTRTVYSNAIRPIPLFSFPQERAPAPSDIATTIIFNFNKTAAEKSTSIRKLGFFTVQTSSLLDVIIKHYFYQIGTFLRQVISIRYSQTVIV